MSDMFVKLVPFFRQTLPIVVFFRMYIGHGRGRHWRIGGPAGPAEGRWPADWQPTLTAGAFVGLEVSVPGLTHGALAHGALASGPSSAARRGAVYASRHRLRTSPGGGAVEGRAAWARSFGFLSFTHRPLDARPSYARSLDPRPSKTVDQTLPP